MPKRPVPMAAAWAAAVLLAAAPAAGQPRKSSPDFGGRLMRAAFFAADPAGALAALDEGLLVPDARGRLLTLVEQVRGLEGMAAVAPEAAGAGGHDDAARDPAAVLEEADRAEGHLRIRRDSPLAGYLYAFLMTRHRMAFELQAARGDVEGQKASAKKYRAFLQRARAATDPLVVWLADDIDRQPFLVAATAAHPREFNPDT